MYFGAVICGLFVAFALGVVFAFTLPGWLVIILQTVILLGFTSCLFKKK